MFGIWGHKQAAEITYYGLHALQHRGQDGAGIVATNGKKLSFHRGRGLVNDIFQRSDFEKLSGHGAIGHVRNLSHDNGSLGNVQPLLFHSLVGSMSLAHHGYILNAEELRGELEKTGSIFQTTTDAEVLAHLMKGINQYPSEETIAKSLNKLKGSFTFLILTENKLYAALDPHGSRPLSVGKLGGNYVVASETCAFDIIGATYEREVNPGEIVTISEEGLSSYQFAQPKERKINAMEYIYYSRPDSNINGINVHAARKRTGIELAKEAPVDADVVTGVPDSSISAAIGYAEQSGLPYEMGVIKNRYVGRTFIKPSQELREQGVKIKLAPVRGIVQGKRVVMIDDSIVRGTTSRRIVNMIRDAGAKEVHVRIAAPPMKFECQYGAKQEELIAAYKSIDEICELIGADSLAFLSVEGLEKAIVGKNTFDRGISTQCFTGESLFEEKL